MGWNVDASLLGKIECSTFPGHDVDRVVTVRELRDDQPVAVADRRLRPGTAERASAGAEQILDRFEVGGRLFWAEGDTIGGSEQSGEFDHWWYKRFGMEKVPILGPAETQRTLLDGRCSIRV